MRTFRVEMRALVSVISFCFLILATNKVGVSQYMCVPTGAVETRMGSIAAGDPTQTGRVFRDGLPSSCGGGVPISAPVSGTYRFDQYSFTNTTGLPACVTVDLDATACGTASTQINAYLGTFDPANVMTNLIGKPGFSTTGTGSLAFPVAAGASYVVTVHEVAVNAGCPNYTIRVTTRTSCDQPGYDSDADGEADFAWFTPGTGQWWVGQTPAGAGSAFTFGQNGDIVTPGDYTGDGRTDLSVYRPSNNTWYYATDPVVPLNNIATVAWGSPGDVPVPADYDRDAKTDIAVWRPSDGRWYILRSTNNTLSVFQWGASTDTPITGDYDGDLIADVAVVRNEASVKRFLILLSNFGNGFVLGCPTATPICGGGTVFGAPTDRPVSGDFDGDFKTDVAVWRPSNGTWYYLRSSSATAANSAGAIFSQAPFGQSGDIPQPADYDGDNKFDLAVMRPGVAWYVTYSSNGSVVIVNTVDPTIQPATSPYRISNP